MTRYLLSDTHFDDEEVLSYTDRPFASVAEMNRTLAENWNRVVESDDEVIFVGDFAEPSEPTTVRRWLGRLNGDITFVAGDHDAGVRRGYAVTTQSAVEFEAGGHRFYCVHDPEAAPPDHEGWVVHGHHHDIRPETYPFVDSTAQRVNVSVELLGYEPISVSELVGYLDSGERLERRPSDGRRG
ncbi:metallophosphoesterase family protein [Natronomonas gomsonensis]|uniref:metallophosphoesterase family protein n=1 Tax=Natronomonas gomsonensis TaxID=1046043 RepID=UPI0015B8534E